MCVSAARTPVRIKPNLNSDYVLGLMNLLKSICLRQSITRATQTQPQGHGPGPRPMDKRPRNPNPNLEVALVLLLKVIISAKSISTKLIHPNLGVHRFRSISATPDGISNLCNDFCDLAITKRSGTGGSGGNAREDVRDVPNTLEIVSVIN